MSYPTPYQLTYSFTDNSSNNPTTQQPGSKLDAEFNALGSRLNQVSTNLALIQKADGTLANGLIGNSQLSSAISFGLSSVQSWVAGTAYAQNVGVWYNSALYRCMLAHTASASFTADFNAGDWQLLVDFSPYLTVAATNAATASNAAATATAAMTAAGTSASQAASSAIAAIAAAGRVIPQAGRLVYTSATALTFQPFKGSGVQVGGSAFTIPNGGIAFASTSVYVNGVAGANLVANTLYYAALLNVSGTAYPAFYAVSGYGHAPDTTAANQGVEVVTQAGSPLTNATLLGLVQTNASAQFQQTALVLGVRSWFNPPALTTQLAASVAGSALSGSPQVIPSAVMQAVLFAGETIDARATGELANASTGVQSNVALALNGTAVVFAKAIQSLASAANSYYPVGLAGLIQSATDQFATVNPLVWGLNTSSTAYFTIENMQISVRGS